MCVFILAGCSNNHGAEEKTSVENGEEEQAEEKIAVNSCSHGSRLSL